MKGVLFLSPLLLIAALLTLQARHTQTPPPLEAPRPEKLSLHCQQPPVYKVGYASESAAVIPRGQGFRFQGVSWIETDICQPGTLTIQASGEAADGQNPTLAVILNSQALANLDVPAKQHTYSVHLPQAGRLTLGYFNDYYLADVRIATLEKFHFSAAVCTTFQIDVPPANGGSWQPDFNSADLVSNVPMTLTPCAAGQLSLQVVGRQGNRAFPILKFEQQGRVLQTITTRQKRQPITLTLSAAPLKVTLINPYGRTVADRNLNVTSLSFTLDVPKTP